MHTIKFSLLILVLAAITTTASARTEKILHTFTGKSDGGGSYTGLIFDKSGNLYGASQNYCFGQGQSAGNVYELQHMKSGWQENVLYTFTGGSDGACPEAGLFRDKKGVLYGTTILGGDANGDGVVFRVSQRGTKWVESVIYQFSGGSDGSFPVGGVTMDRKGNLFGTTRDRGGSCNCGVVFKLSPMTNGGWNFQVLHTFVGGSDGFDPQGRMVIDSAGNFFGTTARGGGCTTDSDGCGTVYELSPRSNGTWNYQIIYVFKAGSDGGAPVAQLALDKKGNLYGTAAYHGVHNRGVVFELRHSSGGWREAVLHNFTGQDGALPNSGVTFDSAGNLYGVTYLGGATNAGVVYKLYPANNKWHEIVLHSFANGTDGAYAWDFGGVAVDKSGNVFGTTLNGGAHNAGIVFEITP